MSDTIAVFLSATTFEGRGCNKALAM